MKGYYLSKALGHSIFGNMALFTSFAPLRSLIIIRSYSLHKGPLVGCDDFGELRTQSDVYIDKSLLIRDLIEGTESGGKNKVTLVTMPRRWGKSLNMDTVEKFLEIEVDDDGNILPEEKRVNRKLFTGGTIEIKKGRTKVLEPLKISQYPDIMEEQGEHPVVSISLKDVLADSYVKLQSKMSRVISTLFRKHEYLVKSTVLTQTYKKILNKYLHNELSEVEIEDGIRFLSELLHKHFGRKVWILIDEYDTPINNAFVSFGTPPDSSEEFTPEFNSVLRLFRGILGSALKGNDSLEKGFVTGILRIAKADLFSSVNNLGTYTILSKKFVCHYGISEGELKELLPRVDLEPSIAEGLKEWYNGYNIAGNVMYNPWSVMMCINNGELGNYWIDSGGLGLIEKVMLDDSIQRDIHRLVHGQGIEIDVSTHVNLLQIHKKDALFSLLLFAGYLNPVSMDDSLYMLSIPNKEVRGIYFERIVEWVCGKIDTDKSILRSLSRSLERCDINTFTKDLKSLLSSSTTNLYVKNEKRAESFYNGFMLGVLSHFSSSYIMESDRESGRGRPDLVLIPKKAGKSIAYILEYKVAEKEDRLGVIAQEGLDQIEERNYKATIKQYEHISKILKVSISFCGKELDVKYLEEKINLSGNGTIESKTVEHVFPYDKFFNKYYGAGIDILLPLRLKDTEDVVILKARYVSDTYEEIDKHFCYDLERSFDRGADKVLVPYNLLNKHWIGMIFERVNGCMIVTVLDSSNNTSSIFTNLLKNELQKSFCEDVKVYHMSMDAQIGDNCGPELIENFYSYMGGERCAQEYALITHSTIFEESLLTPDDHVIS